nr:hypothetical protein CFP56_09100 [Quercus suber]
MYPDPCSRGGSGVGMHACSVRATSGLRTPPFHPAMLGPRLRRGAPRNGSFLCLAVPLRRTPMIVRAFLGSGSLANCGSMGTTSRHAPSRVSKPCNDAVRICERCRTLHSIAEMESIHPFRTN